MNRNQTLLWIRKLKSIREIQSFLGKFLIAYIITIVSIFYLLMIVGCNSSQLVIKQKAVCVYSDAKVAKFAYQRIEHLNQATTIYEAKPGNYKVGRTYIVIISK